MILIGRTLMSHSARSAEVMGREGYAGDRLRRGGQIGRDRPEWRGCEAKTLRGSQETITAQG
jgi:hypothetical protein